MCLERSPDYTGCYKPWSVPSIRASIAETWTRTLAAASFSGLPFSAADDATSRFPLRRYCASATAGRRYIKRGRGGETQPPRSPPGARRRLSSNEPLVDVKTGARLPFIRTHLESRETVSQFSRLFVFPRSCSPPLPPSVTFFEMTGDRLSPSSSYRHLAVTRTEIKRHPALLLHFVRLFMLKRKERKQSCFVFR